MPFTHMKTILATADCSVTSTPDKKTDTNVLDGELNEPVKSSKKKHSGEKETTDRDFKTGYYMSFSEPCSFQVPTILAYFFLIQIFLEQF